MYNNAHREILLLRVYVSETHTNLWYLQHRTKILMNFCTFVNRHDFDASQDLERNIRRETKI